MTGIINFEILEFSPCFSFAEHFDFNILKGLIIGVKRYLRNAADYIYAHLALVLFLQSLLLVGLHADPAYPAATTVNRDHLIPYHWDLSIAEDPPGLDTRSGELNPAILLTQSEYPIKDEHPFGEDGTPHETRPTVEPVTRAFPIWGEKVRAMGYDLPLPFGVGANLVYMEQGIEVRNLKVDIGDTNVDVSGVSFSDESVHDAAATARLDLWLLPFANVYGIFGYINGEAELDVNIPALVVDLPIIGPVPITDPKTVNFNIDYNGTTYGGGVTLAGGYRNFFGSLDVNYTESTVDVIDGKIKTYTASPRLGVLVDPGALAGTLAFWIGAMYMDYKQTVSDDINLRELDPRLPSVNIDFEIDVKNEKHWNFLFGGQWEITKRWQVMAEGGVGNRQQIILGGFFRF